MHVPNYNENKHNVRKVLVHKFYVQIILGRCAHIVGTYILYAYNMYVNSTYSSIYNVFCGYGDVTTVVQVLTLQLNNIPLICDQLVIPNLEFGI